jgi:PAS domain S-box-containing protein
MSPVAPGTSASVTAVDDAQDDLFSGSSETARLSREVDWSKTSLGPVENWNGALRTAVRMTLASPFPINLWCGPDLNLIYNDAYRVLLGAKHPAALGQPGAAVWAEIWHEIEPMFEKIRDGGASAYAENARFLMDRAKGPADFAWFTFSVSPIRDESGDIVAFLNIASETTSRIRAEHEAERARLAAEMAERQLRDVFDQAPAFLAVLRGPDHVFDYINDAYLELVGKRDIVGKPVREALPEVREQGFIDLLDNVYRTGEPFVGREIPVSLASDGGTQRIAHVDFVYQPLKNPDGSTAGVVAHGSDVSAAVHARREVERLLGLSEQARRDAQESEQQYRFMANSIPVQVWTASPDGKLDFVSERSAEYFARTQTEVTGAQWLDVLHPDDVGPTMERWSHSLETGEPYETEFRLWSAEANAYRWHLARAIPQRDDSGRIRRWFGSNTDIEEQKRNEAELERLTREATEANRAKSDFLAAMSHELRTPLNAIGGYAQLIEMGVRGPVTNEQLLDLGRIQRSKAHLEKLVNDVLNFAKLGSGRIEFRPREIKVKDLLESVLDMVKPQSDTKKLRIETQVPADNLKILADDDRAKQILLNLFANALKFTPAGGLISLSVTAAEREVAIDVADTGIGIGKEQIGRIFEPFIQAKKALDVRDEGVGLGLAISRQLARAMNGDLTVRSKLAEGSTFTVTFPKA